jgi:DNA-binding CsgD family transcriptional regulator
VTQAWHDALVAQYRPPSKGTAPPEGADDLLLTGAADFIREGLIAAEPALIVASDTDAARILERLGGQGIDVEEARRRGELAFVDAGRLMQQVLAGGAPDAARFATHMGNVIDGVLQTRGAPLVRVYSTVVDALWTQGEGDAAVRIEHLFFALARMHAFSLMCAHAMREMHTDRERISVERRRATTTRAGIPTVDEAARERERAITRRESDVLRRTALGHANKDIANALGISVRTVEAHKANAMRKLNLIERADVIRFALLQGWLTDGSGQGT